MATEVVREFVNEYCKLLHQNAGIVQIYINKLEPISLDFLSEMRRLETYMDRTYEILQYLGMNATEDELNAYCYKYMTLNGNIQETRQIKSDSAESCNTAKP
jgi:hypothetical protein